MLAQRLVRVVLERLVAQHPHVLLDGLVGVVGTGDEVELGEDLGAVGTVGAHLVLRIDAAARSRTPGVADWYCLRRER